MIGLICRISSLLQGSFAKEPYHFKEPTNRSHPIYIIQCIIFYFKKKLSILHCISYYALYFDSNTLQAIRPGCAPLSDFSRHILSMSSRSHAATHRIINISTLLATASPNLFGVSTLQHTLQRTAIYCNTLQRTATHTLLATASPSLRGFHTATHTATYCNILQQLAADFEG